MIDTIRIQNFRGLADLRLERCSSVNILVGPNGVGKTSVLEALHLACSGNDPGAFQRPAYFRGQLSQPIARGRDLPLRSLFRDLAIPNEIAIELNGPDTAHALRISSVQPGQTISLPPVDQSTDPSVLLDVPELRQLKFAYTHPTKSKSKPAQHEALMLLEDTGIKLESGMCGNCIRSSFIGSRQISTLTEVSELISTLSKHRQRSRLVELMQAVDTRIRDFQVITEGGASVPHVDVEGSTTLLPAHLMGDGFVRLLQIAAHVLTPTIAVVAVDEIDSGIHHSVMTSIWMRLLGLLDQRPFQLFCTTHSEEMIEATLPVFKDRQEMLRIFRLDRKGSSVTSTARDYQTVADLTAGGFELR